MKEKEKYKYDAFISYKRKGGTPWAELVYLALNKVAGKEVWKDTVNLRSGTIEKWRESITSAIQKSKNVIVILFPEINDIIKEKDDPFLEELDIALEESKRRRINIIPFYVEGPTTAEDNFSVVYGKLPENIDTITSREHNQGCKFYPNNPDTWINGLLNCLISTETVLESYCYRVQVNAHCKIMTVYDQDEPDSTERKKTLNSGECYNDFWIPQKGGLLKLRFESEKEIKYKVTIDTNLSKENNSIERESEAIFYTQSQNPYSGYLCGIRIVDHRIIIDIEWDSLEMQKTIKKFDYKIGYTKEFNEREDVDKEECAKRQFNTNIELEHKTTPPTVIPEGETQGHDYKMDLEDYKNVR